jgi:hypothetical protein
MKLDRDVLGHCRITTPNSSKPSATHAERSRGFDVMLCTMLLALLVAAIASDHPIYGEIGGATADRQSYFASAVDLVVNLGLSIGLTWMLFSSRRHGGDKRGKTMSESFSRRRFLNAALAAGMLPVLPGAMRVSPSAPKRLVAGTRVLEVNG